MRVGIDVGGTFVDIVCVSNDGELRIAKVPTSHELIAALESGLETISWSVSDLTEVNLGTTIATNTVIERRGARTALLATEGFRDFLELQRWHRRYQYDLQQTRPAPLAPREIRYGVPERVSAQGTILKTVDEESLRAICRDMETEGVESVAICFLNAHQNGANEREARRIVAAQGKFPFIAISSEVSPLIREWERTSTTVVNAYVMPVIHEFLGRLEKELHSRAPGCRLSIMQSNGGIISTANAIERSVSSVLSGPTAGVVGAALVGTQSGHPDLITMDMGGTSCDVAVIQDGTPELTKEGSIEYNIPITVPMLRIETIGAGGGSIVWVDLGGHLKVGPQSAGADPGPACYNRGGSRPTVTDAQLILGRLPEKLVGGRMVLTKDLAEAALAAVATEVGLPTDKLAAGVVHIANVKMAQAIRVTTVNRGIDPRDFALLAFGGAGPLHACEIATELGIQKILIPPTPGVFSALGLVRAPVKTVAVRSVNQSIDADGAASVLDVAFRELEAEARRTLRDHAVDKGHQIVQRALDMRYPGQTYTVTVQVPGSGDDAADLAQLAEAFHSRHAELYNYVIRDEIPFVVSVEVTAWGRLEEDPAFKNALGADECPDAPLPVGKRNCYLLSVDAWREVPLFTRDALCVGQKLDGPALVDQLDSTTLVEADWAAEADRWGNLLMARRTE